MSALPIHRQSAVERIRRVLSRAGLVIIVALLGLGLAAEVIGDVDTGVRLLAAAFVMLVTMPVLNVVAVLIEEIERREWLFVGCALVVLALLAWRALQ